MLISVLSALLGLGLGIFYAVFPERAKWSGGNISDLPPKFRIWHLRSVRLFGIITAVFTGWFLLKLAAH
jgi:hypothetical protein